MTPQSLPPNALSEYQTEPARAARRKTEVTWVRLTAAEKRRLAHRAMESGMSISACARSILSANL